jgi:hypothetical protein
VQEKWQADEDRQQDNQQRSGPDPTQSLAVEERES